MRKPQERFEKSGRVISSKNHRPTANITKFGKAYKLFQKNRNVFNKKTVKRLPIRQLQKRLYKLSKRQKRAKHTQQAQKQAAPDSKAAGERPSLTTDAPFVFAACRNAPEVSRRRRICRQVTSRRLLACTAFESFRAAILTLLPRRKLPAGNRAGPETFRGVFQNRTDDTAR